MGLFDKDIDPLKVVQKATNVARKGITDTADAMAEGAANAAGTAVAGAHGAVAAVAERQE